MIPLKNWRTSCTQRSGALTAGKCPPASCLNTFTTFANLVIQSLGLYGVSNQIEPSVEVSNSRRSYRKVDTMKTIDIVDGPL